MAGPTTNRRSSPRRQQHDDDTQGSQQQQDSEKEQFQIPADGDDDHHHAGGEYVDDAIISPVLTGMDTVRSATLAAVRGLLTCVLLWNVAVHCHLAYTVFLSPKTPTPPAETTPPAPSPATVNVKVRLPPAPTGTGGSSSIIPDDHATAAEVRAAEAERAARAAATEAAEAAKVRAAAERRAKYDAARAEEDEALAELASLSEDDEGDENREPSPVRRFAERVESLRVQMDARSELIREKREREKDGEESKSKSRREEALAELRRDANRLKRDLAMDELRVQRDASKSGGIGRSGGGGAERMDVSTMLPNTRVVLGLTTLSDLRDEEELDVVFMGAIDELEGSTGDLRSHAAAVDRLDALLRHMAANAPPHTPGEASPPSSACRIEMDDGIPPGGGGGGGDGGDGGDDDEECEDCATHEDLNGALAPLREYLTQRYTFHTPSSAHYRAALRDEGGGGFSSGLGASDEDEEGLPSPLMGPATDRVRERIESTLLEEHQKAQKRRADARRKKEEARWLRRAQRLRDEAAELIRPLEEKCVEVDTLRDMLDWGLDASIGTYSSSVSMDGGEGGDGGGAVEGAVRAALYAERGDDEDDDDDDYVYHERGEGRELNTTKDLLSPYLGYAAINETLTNIPPLPLGLSAAERRNALHLLDSPLLHYTLRKIDDVTEEYVLGRSEFVDDWYDSLSSVGADSLDGGSLHSASVHILASVPLSVPESISAMLARVHDPLSSLSDKIDGAMSKLPNSVQRVPRGAISLGRDLLNRAVANFRSVVAPHQQTAPSVRRTVVGGGSTGVTLPLCWNSGEGKLTLAFDVLSDGLTDDGKGEIELDSMEIVHASTLAGSGSPLERSAMPNSVVVTGVGHLLGTFHLGRYESTTSSTSDDEKSGDLRHSFPVGRIGVDHGGVPLSDVRQILVVFESDENEDDDPSPSLLCIGGLRLLGRVVPREDDSEDYPEEEEEDYVAAGCAVDGGGIGAGGDGSCGAEPSPPTTTVGLNDSTTTWDDNEDDSSDDGYDAGPDDDVDGRRREWDDREHDPHVDHDEEGEDDGVPPMDDEDDEEARWYRERYENYNSDTDTASQSQEKQEEADPMSDVAPSMNESEGVHDEPEEDETGEDRYEEEALDASDAADGQQHQVVGDDGDEMAEPRSAGEDDQYQLHDHNVSEADEDVDEHPSGDAEVPPLVDEEEIEQKQGGEGGDQQSTEEAASAGDEPEESPGDDVDAGELDSHVDDGEADAVEQYDDESDEVGGDYSDERMDGDDHDTFVEDDLGDDYDELGALSSEFEDIADHGENNDLVSLGALREWEEVDELIRENVITEDDFDDLLDRVDTTACSRSGEEDEGGECLDMEGFIRFNAELDLVLSEA